MKFGPGEKLYGSVKLSCLGQLAIGGAPAFPGAEGWLMSATPASTSTNPITEPGANSDPDTTGFAVTPSNWGQTHWVGNYGNIFTNLEGEQGFDLVTDVKYNTITVQKVTKFRPVGMTSSALLAKILGTSGAGGHTSGGILTEFNGAAFAPVNFVLTSASGARSVALVNAEVKSAGFEFGGTTLRHGEIGFVQMLTVAGGASPVYPTNSLIFSA
jgi:hypothetical protein